MTKHVVSARGVVIDFDLLGIKKAMAELPITDNVKKREKFINKRRRRGVKRRVDEMAQKNKLENEGNASLVQGLEVEEFESEGGDSEVQTDAPKRRRKVGK